MSFRRKVERNQLKKRFKEHNEGVAKKHRTRFSSYWKAWNDFYKKKRGNK